jgi:methylmalonyl-CoA mutase cobalamin-binding domain/chain
MTQSESLSEAMANLKEKTIRGLVQLKIQAQVPATEILQELHSGMAEIGDRYQKGEYFISELMYAAEIMKETMVDLEPLLAKGPTRSSKGKVVIGTVKGDIHDIGKDVVVSMLRGAGFEVIDLGVDVDPHRFVEAVQGSGAGLVGLSVFLTMAFNSAAATVQAFEEAGLRDDVAIMVGGGPVTELVRERTGCDFYGEDALDAVRYAEKVLIGSQPHHIRVT